MGDGEPLRRRTSSRCRPASPLHAAARATVILGVRPTAFALDGPRAPSRTGRAIEVSRRARRGARRRDPRAVRGRRAAGEADAVRAAADAGEDEERLLADDAPGALHRVLDGRTRVQSGDTLDLRVDPERMHAFDSAGAAVSPEWSSPGRPPACSPAPGGPAPA